MLRDALSDNVLPSALEDYTHLLPFEINSTVRNDGLPAVGKPVWRIRTTWACSKTWRLVLLMYLSARYDVAELSLSPLLIVAGDQPASTSGDMFIGLTSIGGTYQHQEGFQN